ncbi:ABC transporter substrate-binding protein [Sinanaerobacter chloroacetimidivorans]|jgi:NitT/TauT family transport system substrate-binding protein|uniref:ABC transporter substrate-binding protein n=1 Tax=Sinanaerobacter chloroacetimidivorans TaxID=2818044 RepID=A0A8J7W1T9_9FIRM|nr:ABC transporter substrate-binding protein [Sinanaerobacter chloroacetimidivorans]MBR0597988.1 ABC transporter substrate-binding protein [Sinanaerobacter chloroacetimidivorans]
MKISKKIICVGLCILLSIPLFFGCAKEEEKVKVTLCEVTHSIFYAPQYAAINLGFFEEEGIEIELTNGQGADKVMSAVLSNNIDIGFAGPEASIYVYNEGKDDHTQVFALLTQRDGSFLVGREPDSNFTWDKLKGKNVLPGRKGGVPYMTLEYVIRNHGLDPYQDLTLDNSIQFALMAGAFTSGTGDYVTLFEPTASMLEAEGKGYIVASVGEEAGKIAYTGYFAKKSFIEKNPDLIERFTRAIYRGQEWVANHNAAEIAEAVAPSFPDTDVKLLTTVAERYQEIGAWRDTPIVEEEAYNKLQEVMTQAGELEKIAPYDKVVNNTFAEKVIQ